VRTYTLGRLFALLPVLAVVAVVVFSILRLTPGDPAAVILGDNATPADIEQLHRTLGLDRPPLVQFTTWLAEVARGNLGQSIFLRQPVAEAIADRLEPTLMLTLYALIIALITAVPAGILAGIHPGSWIDRALMFFTLIGASLPTFLVGLLLILVFAVSLEWLPSEGYISVSRGLLPNLRQLLLPAFALGMGQAALIARTTRAAVMDVFRAEYVQTARAKGLGEWTLLWRHALKNAALPIATVIGFSIAMLLGGAVVTETVFNLPGMGRLVINSVLRRDYPVVQGVTLFIAVIYVVVNLVVDLAYAWLDPRVKY
jgi:peptide/nickel transport system permease protein